MVNLSGTERWRELCRLLGLDDGGLDYSTPEGLSKLADREWNRAMLAPLHRGLRRPRRPTSGRRRCWRSRPPWPSATRSPSGWRTSRPASTSSSSRRRGPGARAGAVGRPAGADRRRVRRTAARPPARRGAGRARRPPHRRPLLLLGRTPGVTPAGRARRRRREGGAARRRGRVPDDAGAAQHLCRRQPVEAGDRPRPQDPRGPGRGCSTSWPRPTSSSRTPWRAPGSGSGSDEDALRAVNPALVYARAKGFGVAGPLASAPFLRLRRAGGDRHGDDAGRRCAAGAGQLHGQRLRDRAAAGGGDRAGAVGAGSWAWR